jgi:hypothetical protein
MIIQYVLRFLARLLLGPTQVNAYKVRPGMTPEADEVLQDVTFRSWFKPPLRADVNPQLFETASNPRGVLYMRGWGNPPQQQSQ